MNFDCQPHQVPAQHPGTQGLMLPSKHRPRQLSKLASARLAAVLLPVRLGRIPPLLGDRLRITMRTPYALRPAQFPYRLIAFGIIQQMLDIQPRDPGSRPGKGAVAYPILLL